MKPAASDPVAETLDRCRTIHGDEQLALLERVLARRRELGDRGAERALQRTRMLAELRLDPSTLIASAAALGPAGVLQADEGGEARAEILRLIEGVERLAAIHWSALDEESAESLRRMFVAMAADVRVVLITLCDRLEVIRTLRELSDPEQRRRIAIETRDVFAPLANRLGVWQLKWELEDLALRELEPEIYKQLTAALQSTRTERQQWVGEVVQTLREELGKAGITAKISGRPKHIYSIYNKMRRKEVDFDQVYDVTAVRVIVESKRDCYAALGLVHELWSPIAGEFDDYIARPKHNGYQSLHTAVIGPGGRSLEIQIRTEEMHLFAEYGVAAHWAYKEGKRDAASASERFNVLRQLVDWHDDLIDPKEFTDALKTDLFGDQVHVFTPNGDVIAMPAGATPLDFAYRVHTMVGHRARGALVNGQMVPLTHELQTGDRVEILTKKQPEPSRDWLSPQLGYLKTQSARQKIRQWFRAQDRDQAIVSGREALEREFFRAGLPSAEIGGLDELAARHDFKSGDDLLAAIGFGDLGSQGIAAELLERQRPEPEPVLEPEPPPVAKPERTRDAAAGVSIEGIGDILSQPARCCSPVPGDEVIGWVTRGRGIMIHRRDCANIVHCQEPERLVEIDWGRKAKTRYPVKVALEVVDRPGVLRDIADLVASQNINMRATQGARSKKKPGVATMTLELEVDAAEQIVRILGRLAGLPSVLSVRRVSG
jgi:RelA/SpoT family (p)ppGpp synthetase